MGGGHLTAVSVDAVFEQFPASVRGAVVVRGRDSDPHQIRLLEADLVEVPAPTRSVRGLDLGRVTVDVAPRSEVLIPFEVPFAGLDPGWYAVTAEVEVDGQVRVTGPEGVPRRFVVAWPGEAVRKGTIDAAVRIRVPGSEGALVERVVCRQDSAVVQWRHAPSEDPETREFGEMRVNGDRNRLPVVDGSYEWSTGRRTTTVYPVLVRHRALTFQLDRRLRPGKAVQRGKWTARLPLS